MTPSRPRSSRILVAIREAVTRQGTNPYQITKASGIPLTTVQRLLAIKINAPLRNVEMLMAVLGLDFTVVPSGKSVARPGTGRGRRKRG